MCHSGRRGRARKIRSTNAYACMITDLPFPPSKTKFIKKSHACKTHRRHTRRWVAADSCKTSGTWRGKQQKMEVCFFHCVIYISPISSTLSAPVAVCSPLLPLLLLSSHTHTRTQYISFSHGTGRCTVCIIEIDPVIQLHTTKNSPEVLAAAAAWQRAQPRPTMETRSTKHTHSYEQMLHILTNVSTTKAYEVCLFEKKKKKGVRV